MAQTVFYSWQADSPDKTNKRFIREALNDAVAEVGEELTVEDSPRVDTGMEGISGTPEVASVMFQKIDKCSVFLGDVTLVGTIEPGEEGKEKKRVPNPNVLLEMGYAAARIGWGRVICVMNEHFGGRFEQPFDVRNRRFPIDYTLDPKDMGRRDKVKQDLTRWIKTALEGVFANEHMAVEDAVAKLDAHCLHVMEDYGTITWFPALSPGVVSQGHGLAYEVFTRAVERLLDLGILRCDVNPQEKVFAYHWTHFGRLVLKRLSRQT